MAILKIEPIKVATRGGLDALITGLEPTDHDCIVGEVFSRTDNLTNARWNLSGLHRGGSDASNLDMREAQLQELATLAKRLGAKAAGE